MLDPTSFENVYRNMGVPLPQNPPGTQPAPIGSAVPPINPNQSNVNPATGRPYSFVDSLNDANGQLMYDPSQSDLWNIMNGRFRTQNDPAYGQITPQNQFQGGLAQQLVNTGQMAPPQQPTQNGGMYGNMQFPWGQQTQRVQNLPQPYGGQQSYQRGGMGGGMFGMGGMGGGQWGRSGFDWSNPMNYSGYSNWNQPRQQGKGMGY